MDTLANMLIAIKNAGLVKKATVSIPASKLTIAVLDVLKQEEFIKTYNVLDGIKPTIEVVLLYKSGSPRINDVARISKPSKRVYTSVKDIAPTKYGVGMSVISTPKGVMTDKQARKELVGGEILFTIW
jgi:small subunit ribosomal protein S8